MTRAPIALAAALLTIGAATVAVAQSRTMSIEIDRSARVQLAAPAASVIVGNPAIADVTVVDANTLFITGRGYGVTEIAVVDEIGRTVFQNEVVVTGGSTGAVRVWRGAQATEMACAAVCAPSIRSPAASSAAPAAAAIPGPAAPTAAAPTP
jgi:hypothetical protein